MVSDVLIGIGVLYPIGAVICCIIGLINKKTEYSAVKQRRFAVLICARNEEQVIGNLLDSLALQDYPKECVTCFVVAHNCTDQTAHLARKHGAVVFEWNHPMKRTKGDVLHFGVGQITEQYPGQYEALCIFDADNLAGRSFLKEINAALDSGADVVTGFRCAKNYHQTPISELFGAYWYQIMYTQNIPNSAMGLPVVVGGTGFAVTMEVLKKGWNTETLLEDIEFSLQMILHEKRIIIAPRAVFYDEQPSDLRSGLRQRYRWACGEYQILRRYLPQILRMLPVRRTQILGILPSVLINPIMLLTLSGCILQVVIKIVNGGMIGGFIYLLQLLILVWISTLPLTVMLFLQRKLSVRKNLATLFLFPCFLMLSMPLSAIALFDRCPEWKPIPHHENTALPDIENLTEPRIPKSAGRHKYR